MRKQIDLERGCVAACALEVMERLSPPGTLLPTEAKMVEAILAAKGSTGFQQLTNAIAGLGLPFRVVLREPATLEELRADAGRLPLVCVDFAKPYGCFSAAAHCWVIEGYRSCAIGGDIVAGFLCRDPHPELADEPQIVLEDDFAEIAWTGGYAIVESAAPPRIPATEL